MKMLGTHRLESREKTHRERAGGRAALVESESLAGILPGFAKRLRLVGGLSDGEAVAMLGDLVGWKDEHVRRFIGYSSGVLILVRQDNHGV